jgi:PAS domain S-box-containing protein
MEKNFSTLIRTIESAELTTKVNGGFQDLAEELEKVHPELAAILESITDAFYILNRDWQVIYWNRQAELLLEKSRTEVLGRNIWAVYPEEVSKGFYNRYHKVFEKMTPVHFEEYFKRLHRTYEVNAYPSSDGIAVFFRDITEKKEKDEKLRESNERYALLSKATSEVVWDWKVGSDQMFWHGENLKNLLGYDLADEFSSLDLWTKNVHPEDRDRVLEGVWRAINSGLTNFSEEYRFKNASGTYRYIKDRNFVVRDESGTAIRMVGSMNDITSQKLTELALIRSESDYRDLFENAPLPQFIFDLHDFRIKVVNKATLKKYGYSVEELLEMKAIDFRPEHERKNFIEFMNELNNCGQPATAVTTHIRKDGQKMIVRVSVAKITYRGEVCVLGTTNDITETKLLERKVSNLKSIQHKKVTEAKILGQEEEREVLGKELHDNINQVLTTTRLYLECALTNEPKRVEMIEKSKDYLSYAINELRSISLLLMPSTVEHFGLLDAINRLLNSYQTAQSFEAKFHYEGDIEKLPGGVKITVFRIIQEQLTNVVKHADATLVDIRLLVASNLKLSIKDNGKGFDRSVPITGTGIKNMKDRTRAHNGKLSILTSAGKGCWLRVMLPIRNL